jgi:hypothetical protein
MNMIAKLALALLLAVASAAAQAGAVVAARNTSLPQLDADQARRVFLGLQRSVNGQTVVSVVFQARGPVRTDFEIKVIGKTGADLTAYLSMLLFTGRAVAPVEVTSDDGVKARVSINAGAVGYISDAAIDDSVKVLLRY